MEQPAKHGKTYHSAGYLTSALVYYGTLLFLLSRVLGLIVLFSEAIARKRDSQALPEQFTVLGIVGILLVIGVAAAAFVLLFRLRRRLSSMRRGVLYLFLNLLLTAWGLIHAVNHLIEMVLFFEFLNLFDLLALAGGLILPSVLLQFADSRKRAPNDTALLAGAAVALVSGIVSTLIIVVLAFRKSYTTFPLLRDLLFHAAILLFGAAGLKKALKLRAGLILLAPAAPASAPEHRECPDCGKRVPLKLDVCPRCGYALSKASLFSDDEPDDAPGPLPAAPEPAKAAAAEAEQKPAPARVVISDGTAACARCERRIPRGLATCPFCGYFPGDPAEPEPPKTPAPDAGRDAASTAYVPRAEERPLCPSCGKRIPGGLATCPFCGHYPGDDAKVAPEPERERDPQGQADPYERLFPADLADGIEHDARDTRQKKRQYVEIPNVRLNEKNSIVCPQCGRKFYAALDICPLCGFGLYDD